MTGVNSSVLPSLHSMLMVPSGLFTASEFIELSAAPMWNVVEPSGFVSYSNATPVPFSKLIVQPPVPSG